MKKLFREIALSLVLLLGVSLLQPAHSVYGAERTLVENKDILKEYEELVKNSKPNYGLKTKNTNLNGDFDVLNLVTNSSESNIELINFKENKKSQSIIALNTDTDTYILIEANNVSGKLVYIVNGEEFEFVQDRDNINLVSRNGYVLPVLITEYEDKGLVENEFRQYLSQDNLVKTSFGREYGPFEKTNKVIVDVLGVVSLATGVLGYKIKHPVLGIISIVTGAISTIGGNSYATLYIQYYQSYATNDPTYVKQRERFYNYNNYTGFVKERTWYFHSSRP
ncbi:MAG: hypothetical protein RR620_08325 [Clostridium sp.]